jgi:hypothetical protein
MDPDMLRETCASAKTDGLLEKKTFTIVLVYQGFLCSEDFDLERCMPTSFAPAT